MDQFSNCDSDDLVRALKMYEGVEVRWSDEDYAAILQHQLDAPLVPEIAVFLGISCDDPALAIVQFEGPPIRSLRDLLTHPHPPLPLMAFAKEMAKASGSQATGLPRDIARVLYIAVIVKAKRHGYDMSSLDENSLRTGIRWATALNWIDKQIKDSLEE